ncbi:hypothetical protein FEM48_Zijuj01G0104000 [Ziziphus jujuba var. spinosa]|uniref:EGF-like domain-containing protein n=1 Tax=Ziziphus jujuba var. spinosa TaxID=714518 RepID=A0A978W0Q1_ZIZJJ|nr:hypothetical protein FEM48_Zijuj01G0104000 [Ziziphus jujuba var. spinosa]
MDKKLEAPRLPLVINWAIGDDDEIDRCDEVENRVNCACKGNSECIDVNDGSGGYRCKCLEGYEGNPYHPVGCQEGYANGGTACTKREDATNHSDILLILCIALGLIKLEKHPWGKVDISGEETEYLLVSASNTYENSSGESGGLRSGATTGYHSMQIQMLSSYNDAR